MKLYGGVDLHSTNRVVAVTDEQDKVVYRKRLANDLGTILSALEPYARVLGWPGSGVDLQLVLVG